jgi:pre-mRNA-splicing factor 18
MEECIRRLRAMGQPIRLFAETDKQCKLRLRALELMDEQQSEVKKGKKKKDSQYRI